MNKNFNEVVACNITTKYWFLMKQVFRAPLHWSEDEARVKYSWVNQLVFSMVKQTDETVARLQLKGSEPC
jgi:hypothetical protein